MIRMKYKLLFGQNARLQVSSVVVQLPGLHAAHTFVWGHSLLWQRAIALSSTHRAIVHLLARAGGPEEHVSVRLHPRRVPQLERQVRLFARLCQQGRRGYISRLGGLHTSPEHTWHSFIPRVSCARPDRLAEAVEDREHVRGIISELLNAKSAGGELRVFLSRFQSKVFIG